MRVRRLKSANYVEDGGRRRNVVGAGASTLGELRTRAKTATADEMFKWLLAERGLRAKLVSSSSTAASGSWSQPKKRSERFYLSWNRRVQERTCPTESPSALRHFLGAAVHRLIVEPTPTASPQRALRNFLGAEAPPNRRTKNWKTIYLRP